MINYYIDFGAKSTILLTGCIHGNEPASEFTLRDFAKHLIDGGNFHPSLSSVYDFNYHIFPRVNRSSFRTTTNNIDLNRKFPNYKAKEAHKLVELLQSKYYYAIDVHETLPCEIPENGFYLYETKSHIGEDVINALEGKGIGVNESLGVQRIPKTDWQGGFDEYCVKEKGVRGAITLETHTSLPMDIRIYQQTQAILEIIRRV